ncbi:hypothetical protein L1987_13916 [Smallanthus sonchifolius]|uniref:Uncharacterized protein n=1 Tax=Smallanthus sonchifolius TaxID=185202 RepID=A0ACB9JJY7_9ASTR|nr:hypothetical protein L1987_13916 [Smallanthus sonchifolius]
MFIISLVFWPIYEYIITFSLFSERAVYVQLALMKKIKRKKAKSLGMDEDDECAFRFQYFRPIKDAIADEGDRIIVSNSYKAVKDAIADEGDRIVVSYSSSDV